MRYNNHSTDNGRQLHVRSTTRGLLRRLLPMLLVLIVLLCASTNVEAATCPVEPGYEPFGEHCEGADCVDYTAFCGPPGGGGEDFDSTTTSTGAAIDCSTIASECTFTGLPSTCATNMLKHQCTQLYLACGADRACVMEELNRFTELFGGSCPPSSTTTMKPVVDGGECSALVVSCSVPGLGINCTKNILTYKCEQIDAATCHGNTTCLITEMEKFTQKVGGTCVAGSSSTTKTPPLTGTSTVNCTEVIKGCSLGTHISSSCGTDMLRYTCKKHDSTARCKGNVSCVTAGVHDFAELFGGGCASTPIDCTEIISGCTLDKSMSTDCGTKMIRYECMKGFTESCKNDHACTKESVHEFCSNFGGGCGVNCTVIVASTSHSWGGGVTESCEDALLHYKCKEFSNACDSDEACVVSSMNAFVSKFT